MQASIEPEVARALQLVFKRCQTDMDFRQLCLIDPIAAIEEASGLRLPPNTVIKFVEPVQTEQPAEQAAPKT